jgi:hypothetical protein
VEQLYALADNEEIRMKVKKPTSKPKVQRGLPSLEIDYFSDHSRSQEFA